MTREASMAEGWTVRESTVDGQEPYQRYTIVDAHGNPLLDLMDGDRLDALHMAVASPELVEALETMTAQADALTDCLNEFTREEDGASVCGECGDHLNRTIHKARALLSRIREPGQGREE